MSIPVPVILTEENKIDQDTSESETPDQLSTTKRIKDADFRMIVITYNRPASLQRLLDSLNKADYLSDKVVIEVWIDRSKSNEIHGPTYETASKFVFDKGQITVHNHTKHAGLYGQWIDTWQPNEDTKEMAVILEDDISVSPLFYRYLKKVHARYDRRPEVNGFALQGISIKHGGAGGNLRAPLENVVFLYPILGSWGFSPRKDNWIKFRQWYKTASKDKNFKPLVPGILPTQWYQIFLKRGKTDGMWTMWHIYYAYSKKERTLYPNFPNKQGMTINWKESGIHYKKGQKNGDPLVTEWDSRLDNLPDEPIHLDANGRVVKY